MHADLRLRESPQVSHRLTTGRPMTKGVRQSLRHSWAKTDVRVTGSPDGTPPIGEPVRGGRILVRESETGGGTWFPLDNFRNRGTQSRSGRPEGPPPPP